MFRVAGRLIIVITSNKCARDRGHGRNRLFICCVWLLMTGPLKLSPMQRFVSNCAELLMAQRKVLLGFFLLVTLALGYSATQVRLDPGFNKQIPVRHAYMVNFLDFSRIFTGANRLLVSVHWKGQGDIYNPEFLQTL